MQKQSILTVLLGTITLSSVVQYASVVQAELVSTAAGAPAVAQSAQDVPKQDPALVRGVLPNGVIYYIRANAESKGRMSAFLRVGTGSMNETEAEQGVAHFIEHLNFNGSRHYKRGEMIQAMQRLGMDIGKAINAGTGLDKTLYMINLPKNDSATVQGGLQVLRDFADGATLTLEDIDKERGIITSEYKARDSATYRTLQGLLRLVFDGTVIPNRMPIGDLDVIQNAPREVFTNYYSTHYVAPNMQVVLVGDFDVKDAQKWVEAHFSSIPKQDYNFTPNYGKLKEPTERHAKWIAHPDLPALSIQIMNVAPFIMEPDTVAKRIKDIPLYIAHAVLAKRIDKMTKTPACAFLGMDVSQNELFNMARMHAVSVTVSPTGDWRVAVKQAVAEVKKAVEYGFTQDEVDDVVKDLRNELKVAVDTWATASSSDIAEEIADTIDDDEVFTAPEEDKRITEIALQSVTPESCQQALKSEWKPSTVQIMISSATPVDKGEEAMLALFDEAVKSPVSADKKVEKKVFAYDSVGNPSAPAATVIKQMEVADLGITQLILSNGVRVNLKSTDFAKDTISISCDIEGGHLTLPKDKMGLKVVASFLLPTGGLQEHSADDLVSLMAGKRVGVSLSPDAETFTLSGGTNQQDVLMQLKLMCAYIMHYGYRPDGEVMFKRGLPMIELAMKTSPEIALQMEAYKYIYNNDARFYTPSIAEFKDVTTEDLKNWMSPSLSKGYMEVSIVGDFNKEQIISMLLNTVGKLPARADAPAPVNEPPAQLAFGAPLKEFFYQSSIDKTVVCVGFPTCDGTTVEQRMDSNVLKEIVKERMFQGIRQKLGETYSPSTGLVTSDIYKNMAHIITMSSGVVGNKEKVADAIQVIIVDLAAGNITADELERARKPMIARMEKSLRDNGAWLGVLSYCQAKPQQLDDKRKAQDYLKGITVEYINDMAKKIDTTKVFKVNILPDGVK